MSQPTKRKWRVTRRGFLLGLGATGGALALGWTFGKAPLRLFLAEQLDGGEGPPSSVPTEPTAWFEIHPDNQVTLYVPKVEMGQGIHTSIAQIAADELEIDWEQLQIVQGSTHTGPATGVTGGSNSVSSVYLPLREAAATLREMLRKEAGLVLGVGVDMIAASGGVMQVKGDAGKSVTYGELIQASTNWEVPEELAPLKEEKDFRYIGKPMARIDLPAKLTGQAIYSFDMRVPNMLYGAVARPRTIEGKIVSAKIGNARERDEVVDVVIEDNFAGVVAETRQQAWTAVNALDVTWDAGKLWQQAEIDALVTVQEEGGTYIQKEGDVGDIASNTNAIHSEYRTPFAIHASMEPQAALADVKADKATIWASTQGASTVQGELADMLGMEAEQIEVIPTYLGGGFGRKLNIESATEAARLSKAVGRPVHVGWLRREAMQNGYFRPPTHHQLSATLHNGRIESFQHKQASGDVAFPFMPGIAQVVLGADFGSWRGARVHYNIANKHVIAQRTPVPVRTGWWRGLGLLANVFAIESFMDTLAATVSIDPLQFRLNHLGTDGFEPRLRAVLERVAEMANWGQVLPEGRARGVACAMDAGTVTAQIAEISLDETSGEIRVHKVWAALEPGRIINPDGAKAQVQGAVMMGLSSTLIEEMTIQDGEVTVANFDRYPLLTMKQSPDVEVELLERPNATPTGIGEPPIGPIAAAVGNAFFTLTGKQLRQIPFTPERVLAILRT